MSRMFPQRVLLSCRARPWQMVLVLLRCQSTCAGHGKYSTHTLPLCSLNHRNRFSPHFWGTSSDFHGNRIFPSTVCHPHLFRSFSASTQQSPEAFSDDLQHESNAKDENAIKISSTSPHGMRENPNENKLLDEEKESSDSHVQKLMENISLKVEAVAALRADVIKMETELKWLKILKNKSNQLAKIYAKLKSETAGKTESAKNDSNQDLTNEIKNLKYMDSNLENTKSQLAKRVAELEQEIAKVKESKVGEESKGKVVQDKKQPVATRKTFIQSNIATRNKKQSSSKTFKKRRVSSKVTRDSEVVTLEHPWAEWVSFLELLNEKKYLSKALNLNIGQMELRDIAGMKERGFIKFAAASFAKDNGRIANLLSGSDLRKVALAGCPTVEKNCVFAGKRLRSFLSIEENIACLPCKLKDKCSVPLAKVPKVKHLAFEDVVKLICEFSLKAEQNVLLIPDDVKFSVNNLLKEIVNFSTSPFKCSQSLLVQQQTGLVLKD